LVDSLVEVDELLVLKRRFSHDEDVELDPVFTGACFNERSWKTEKSS
jgi:hypothetical protein